MHTLFNLSHPLQAGDPSGSGVVSFVNLVQLLSEHQLYVSESGLIARYGKTKGVQGGNLGCSQRATQSIKNFFAKNTCCMIWVLLYILLNVVMFCIGIGAAVNAGRSGWNLLAFGAGPVLSMNCVLVLLPTLSSLIHAMRNSSMMNKVNFSLLSRHLCSTNQLWVDFFKHFKSLSKSKFLPTFFSMESTYYVNNIHLIASVLIIFFLPNKHLLWFTN